MIARDPGCISTEGRLERRKIGVLPCLRKVTITIVIVKLNSRDIRGCWMAVANRHSHSHLKANHRARLSRQSFWRSQKSFNLTSSSKLMMPSLSREKAGNMDMAKHMIGTEPSATSSRTTQLNIALESRSQTSYPLFHLLLPMMRWLMQPLRR
jgi:hypothetical protein